MPRALLLALALGGLSALAHAAVLLGGMGGLILALLASLPLFYAGLTAGPRGALVAGAAGTVMSLTLGLWPAVGYVTQVALAPVLLTNRAVLFRTGPDETTEWYPVGHLIGWLTGIAAVALTAAHLWFIGGETSLVGQLQVGLRAYLAEVQRQGLFQQMQVSPEELSAMAMTMARLVPGVAACFWIMLMAGNGALAQGLALRFGKAIRPATPLSGMELPNWLVMALAVSIGLSFAGGAVTELGTGLSMVFAIPFLFQGCAVVHAAARLTSFPGILLGAFYALLVVIGAIVMLVILLGLLEQWIKLRRRLNPPGA